MESKVLQQYMFYCNCMCGPKQFVVSMTYASSPSRHDDVIKWKHFPRYWPFVRGIHRSPVNSPSQRPVKQSFDAFFDLHLNIRVSKQSTHQWLETPSRPWWRHSKGMVMYNYTSSNDDHRFWYWLFAMLVHHHLKIFNGKCHVCGRENVWKH